MAVRSQRAEVRDAPVQRRGAKLADAAEGRFEPDHAAKRRRDADRAAAVCADGDGTQARRHRRRRSAGTAAGVVRRVVGIARRAVMRVQAGHADADLVHVGLADQQRARRPHPGDRRRVLPGGSLPRKVVPTVVG